MPPLKQLSPFAALLFLDLACSPAPVTLTVSSSQPRAAAPSQSVEPTRVGPAPAATEPATVATPNDTTAPREVCEGQRHLTTPAVGFGNDRPFTVSAGLVWGQSEGDCPSLEVELGTHADRFTAGEAYRGVTITVFADAARLTLAPGTYAIPHWEKNGPIWSAMLNVSSSVGLGSHAYGELVIDQISAAQDHSPATVAGSVWLCVAPIPEFPGPQWIGGTFVARVETRDRLHGLPAKLQVKPGSIVAWRGAAQSSHL